MLSRLSLEVRLRPADAFDVVWLAPWALLRSSWGWSYFDPRIALNLSNLLLRGSTAVTLQ